MGFFTSIFGGQSRQSRITLAGSGEYYCEFDIVGESHYQGELEKIVGGRTDESVEFECEAVLVPETSNPHDENAVAVHIKGRTVGYLSRNHAAKYRRVLGEVSGMCDAEIVGGWQRSSSTGHFGVKLDLAWPPREES